MSLSCAAPSPDLGIALRLSDYLDCQARAIGENGFQALAGGPIAASLLSGLVTIFVALIGYRLILGRTPAIGDGVGWAVRLGVVLALVTSWPAYQILVYNVAVDGPAQLSQFILPAAGLPGEDIGSRVQQAYDVVRLGQGSGYGQAPDPADPLPPSALPEQSAAPQILFRQSPPGQQPLPQTASLLVLSTVGVTAALRLAIGFLLAVGPLAVMSLLFDATLGIFSGWVRALAGAALAMLASTIVTAVDLVMVESELARLRLFNVASGARSIDPQAIPTLVLVFALVMLVATLVAMRMAGAFRLPMIARRTHGSPQQTAMSQPSSARAEGRTSAQAVRKGTRAPQLSRASTIADALVSTVRREGAEVTANSAGPGRASLIAAGGRGGERPAIIPLGVGGRRSIGRRSVSARRRDGSA